MDWFARRGFVCWCVDMEGYGRSDKKRDINCDIANGADDLAAATDYIMRRRAASRSFHDLRHFLRRAARRAVRAAPPRARRAPRARRVRLDRRRQPDARAAAQEAARISRQRSAARSTALSSIRSSSATIRTARRSASSTPSPTPSSRSTTRCPTAPTSTCARSCRVVDPAKITVPTLILRGQYDGIAGFDDLIEFFKRLPNPDKQFSRHARHLARELPAEELPDGLSHPARVFHAARPGVRRRLRTEMRS